MVAAADNPQFLWGTILAAIAIPLIPLWRRSGRLDTVKLQWIVIRAVAIHLSNHEVIGLGTNI